MYKSVFFGGIVSLLLSSAASAETVYFPEEIIPLQVDEKVIEHSFFSRVDELELNPGTYSLKLKYSDLYEQGYDEHHVVDSEPFWVSVTIDQGKNYDIVFNRADNAVAAEVFAESPQISLKAKGSSLGMPLQASITAPRAQAAPTASTNKPAVASMPVSAPISKPAPTTAQSPSASAMLDFWWQQASPEERKRFLNKVTK
ncbi:DUF2057 domain-containing protein [Pseudoalteromonas sp. KS88]|uniref:DUF2057 domain-containing protein n=1 Tax=Pseudoalteromonas sp. KS88 TaxID=2109918 RepID=UPI00108093E2|nr:DUF2057 domain-containing protein [Pseudoalteromonas sp. KS88]TGE76240.1 DUF2057 domain-containing protein [Pseudoalteromonas sp. KS88]